MRSSFAYPQKEHLSKFGGTYELNDYSISSGIGRCCNTEAWMDMQWRGRNKPAQSYCVSLYKRK